VWSQSIPSYFESWVSTLVFIGGLPDFLIDASNSPPFEANFTISS
jgi:hypothetical protein